MRADAADEKSRAESPAGSGGYGRRPYSGTASAAAKRALSTLEKAGIAERSGRGAWSIPEPLLREYLTTSP
jgi:hypothetical protein